MINKIMTADEAVAGVKAVSYTHLDVYKRQGKKTYRYEGVSALGEGLQIKSMEPSHLLRHERNKH